MQVEPPAAGQLLLEAAGQHDAQRDKHAPANRRKPAVRLQDEAGRGGGVEQQGGERARAPRGRQQPCNNEWASRPAEPQRHRQQLETGGITQPRGAAVPTALSEEFSLSELPVTVVVPLVAVLPQDSTGRLSYALPMCIAGASPTSGPAAKMRGMLVPSWSTAASRLRRRRADVGVSTSREKVPTRLPLASAAACTLLTARLAAESTAAGSGA